MFYLCFTGCIPGDGAATIAKPAGFSLEFGMDGWRQFHS